MNINNYIFEKDGDWFFYDEFDTDVGPFDSKEESIENLMNMLIG